MTSNLLLSPFLDRAIAEPDRLFGKFHEAGTWSDVTLGTIMRRALQWTALLQDSGIPVGSTVMLVMRHGPDAPACFIGSMLAGMVPAFLPCPSVKQDPAMYWAQHTTVLAFNRSPIVLVVDDLLEDMTRCAEGSGSDVLPFSAIEAYAPAAMPQRLPDDAEVALLQHSSGTTGLKKGVKLSYRSIARQLTACSNALRMDSATASIVTWLPLYHDMGLISSFLLPLWMGIPIFSIDPFVWVAQPELYFDAIEQFGATHGWLPNFAFLHLARRVPRKREWKLGSIKALINCSEPCKPASFDVFLERFQPMGMRPEMLQASYGMAETVFAVSQSNVTRPIRRLSVDPECTRMLGPVRPPVEGGPELVLISNGPPIETCEVRVLRGDEVVGQGEIGEFVVRAPYMFSGYNLNPEQTAAAFVGDWYRTGDIGFLEQGEIFVCGRTKDVIIVNGKNLFVHDIEAAVSRVEGVKPGRCVAFGRYSEKAGSELLIVVAERDYESSRDKEVLRDINRAVVDETGVPCSDIRLVELGWLVKTTSGKTSRADNAVKYGQQFVSV